MSMQDSLPSVKIDNAPLHVQLMNLGRTIENPALISEFLHDDFSCHEIKMLIFRLKSDASKEAKNMWLKEFMTRRGVRGWTGSSSLCRQELFNAQRRQATMSKIVAEMFLLKTFADTAGYSYSDKEALQSLRRARKLFESTEWAIEDDGSVPEEESE